MIKLWKRFSSKIKFVYSVMDYAIWDERTNYPDSRISLFQWLGLLILALKGIDINTDGGSHG